MVIYSKASTTRFKRFAIITTIEEQGNLTFVRKRPAFREGRFHIDSLLEKQKLLEHAFRKTKVLKGKKDQDSVVFPFLKGKTLLEEFYEYYFMGDEEKVESVISEFNEILESAHSVTANVRENKEFISIFGKAPEGALSCLAVGCLDLNLDNLIRSGKDIYLLDYEWVFNFPIPKEFIRFRSFFYAFAAIKDLIEARANNKNPVVEIPPILSVPKHLAYLLGKKQNIWKWYKCELNFQRFVQPNFSTDFKKYKQQLVKNSTRNNVFHQLKNLRSEIEYLEDKTRKMENEIETLKDSLAYKDNLLESIYRSKGWKVVRAFQVVKQRIKKGLGKTII